MCALVIHSHKICHSQKKRRQTSKENLVLEFAQSNADVKVLSSSYGFYIDIIRKLNKVEFSIFVWLHQAMAAETFTRR